MRQVKTGSANISVEIYIIDSSDGTPEIGVLFDATGMDLKYRKESAAVVSITEVTLASLTTAHAAGGFLEIGNGVYRLDLPDAAVSDTGAKTVEIFGTVTGMIILPITLQLVDFDPNNATNLGLSDITTILDEARHISGDLLVVSGDVVSLQADMTTTLGEVRSVSGDVVAVSGDMLVIDAEVGLISGDVANILVDTADMQPKLGTPANDISADIVVVKNDIQRVSGDLLVVSGDVVSVLEDTGTTIPASLTVIDIEVGLVSGDVALILTDTNETQGKLPTNKFMGSSDGADDNNTLDSILSETRNTSGDVVTLQADMTTTLGEVRSISGDLVAVSGDLVVVDTEVGLVSGDVIAIRNKTDNLPQGMKKNTAFTNFEIFMADSADHVTGKTGLSITAERSLDGGAFASMANSATELSAGVYVIDLDAADTNADSVTYKFTGSGADATIIHFKTEA